MTTPAAVIAGEARVSDEVVRRFWSKVSTSENDGCWLWRGAINANGYANFCLRHGQTIPGHRFSFLLNNGPIPEGLIVRHRCDVRTCVNPSHLEVGTQADNVRDMMERGRAPTGSAHYSRQRPWLVRRGVAHHAAKITHKDASEIRRLRASGVSGRSVAAMFGISPQQVSKIVTGLRWKSSAETP